MSPAGQSRGKKAGIPDNVYTVMLALAFLVTAATVGFVVYMCHTQYGTIFKITGPYG